MDYYDEEQGMTNPDYKEDWFLRGKEIAHENENSLGSFTFNRKERLDVKKPGPFFPNSENNFFFEKVKNINCVSIYLCNSFRKCLTINNYFHFIQPF